MNQVSPLLASDAALFGELLNAIQHPILMVEDEETAKSSKLELIKFMGVNAYNAEIASAGQDAKTSLMIGASSLTVMERYQESSSGSKRVYRYDDYKFFEGVRIPHTILIKDSTNNLCRFSLVGSNLAYSHIADAY